MGVKNLIDRQVRRSNRGLILLDMDLKSIGSSLKPTVFMSTSIATVRLCESRRSRYAAAASLPMPCGMPVGRLAPHSLNFRVVRIEIRELDARNSKPSPYFLERGAASGLTSPRNLRTSWLR